MCTPSHAHTHFMGICITYASCEFTEKLKFCAFDVILATGLGILIGYQNIVLVVDSETCTFGISVRDSVMKIVRQLNPIDSMLRKAHKLQR